MRLDHIGLSDQASHLQFSYAFLKDIPELFSRLVQYVKPYYKQWTQ